MYKNENGATAEFYPKSTAHYRKRLERAHLVCCWSDEEQHLREIRVQRCIILQCAVHLVESAQSYTRKFDSAKIEQSTRFFAIQASSRATSELHNPHSVTLEEAPPR